MSYIHSCTFALDPRSTEPCDPIPNFTFSVPPRSAIYQEGSCFRGLTGVNLGYAFVNTLTNEAIATGDMNRANHNQLVNGILTEIIG